MFKPESMPCLVCGTLKRTAFHFGSHACTACASFFRRTVSFGIRFLCKAGNNCSISPDIRFLCRSCRFDSCIRAGMRRDLVQEKRNNTRLPKYVIESRELGVKEVVRGYQTSKYVNFSEGTPTCTSSADSCLNEDHTDTSAASSTRSNSPEDDGSEFSTILNVSHNELLQFYVNQVQMSAVGRQFELPDDPLPQFTISKQINDQLALKMCLSCPGTDLLEAEDLQILFRYCSFASLWMDSAWIFSRNDISRKDMQTIPYGGGESIGDQATHSRILAQFVARFQSVVTSELARLQLDLVEYAALKSFCIWKLGLLDSTLTLKIVAQEQYYGVTTALSKYYQTSKSLASLEMATRLADITLILGSIFNMYQESCELYDVLGIGGSISEISP